MKIKEWTSLDWIKYYKIFNIIAFFGVTKIFLFNYILLVLFIKLKIIL